MKILIVGPVPSNKGGIARWSDIYAEYLKCNNIDYEFLDTSPIVSDKVKKNIIIRIVTSLYTMRKIIKKLKKTIKDGNIAAIHIATSASLSLYRDNRILKICDKNELFTIYHYHFGTFTKLKEKNNNEYKTLVNNSKMSSICVCIDKATYENGKNVIDNLIYIPNPVVVSNNTCIKKEKNVVFAGHVRQNKGISELLEAWEMLYPKYKEWKLLIAGELFFEYIDKAKASNNSEKNIFYFGKIPFSDLQNMLENSSIFVLPSYFEGCPNVILEAMDHRMAIVGTNVGGIPDLIKDCGILVEPKDSKQLAKALSDLMENDKLIDNLSKKAKSVVDASYSVQNICSKYVQLIPYFSKSAENSL